MTGAGLPDSGAHPGWGIQAHLPQTQRTAAWGWGLPVTDTAGLLTYSPSLLCEFRHSVLLQFGLSQTSKQKTSQEANTSLNTEYQIPNHDLNNGKH